LANRELNAQFFGQEICNCSIPAAVIEVLVQSGTRLLADVMLLLYPTKAGGKRRQGASA
jgi:hypothetical protein